jgi:hypothetical protein
LGGDLIGNCEKKCLYELLSTDEYLPMEMFESPKLFPLDFCLCGWKNSVVNERKVDTPDELLDRILDDAASIKKSEDQLRRTTRDLRTRVAKCTEVDGEILERLL